MASKVPPLQIYLNEKRHRLIVAIARDNLFSRSEAGLSLISKAIDNIPVDEQKRLLAIYDGMSAEEKHNPRKLV